MTESPVFSSEQSTSRSLDLLGVIAVLCLAVFPDIYRAIVARLWVFEEQVSFLYMTTSLIVRSIQVTVPLVVIVMLSKIEWESIGLLRFRWGIDTASGIGIWLAGTLAFYFVFYTAYFIFSESWLSFEESEFVFEDPQGAIDYSLLLVASCANGFAEEFVMRGYLLTRVERLLNSTWAALLISTILFAAYHLYQGTASAIGIVGVGFIYGGAFCLWRRLWPVVIAHAIADVVGLAMI